MCFFWFGCSSGEFAKLRSYRTSEKIILRKMQTAQSVPVRYGPTSELVRDCNEAYRRFKEEEDDDDEDTLPEGKCSIKILKLMLLIQSNEYKK